jgi:hypothetical protein
MLCPVELGELAAKNYPRTVCNAGSEKTGVSVTQTRVEVDK